MQRVISKKVKPVFALAIQRERVSEQSGGGERWSLRFANFSVEILIYFYINLFFNLFDVYAQDHLLNNLSRLLKNILRIWRIFKKIFQESGGFPFGG